VTQPPAGEAENKTEDKPGEDEAEAQVTYLPEAEANAGHRAMAFSELRRQGCSHTALGYDADFESYYCQKCNIWAEPACSDRQCIVGFVRALLGG
jgi:hypothetical protein